QVVLMRAPVGGCQFGVCTEALSHLGHDATCFQGAHGPHGARAGQVEGRGKGAAVLQPGGCADHQRPAATAAGGDPHHSARDASELFGHGLQVTGPDLLRFVHSSTSPAICTESHTVRYHGPDGATSTGPCSLL